jgi:hypothetical protein
MWHYKDTTTMQYVWLVVILIAIIGFAGVAIF